MPQEAGRQPPRVKGRFPRSGQDEDGLGEGEGDMEVDEDEDRASPSPPGDASSLGGKGAGGNKSTAAAAAAAAHRPQHGATTLHAGIKQGHQSPQVGAARGGSSAASRMH